MYGAFADVLTVDILVYPLNQREPAIRPSALVGGLGADLSRGIMSPSKPYASAYLNVFRFSVHRANALLVGVNRSWFWWPVEFWVGGVKRGGE